MLLPLLPYLSSKRIILASAGDYKGLKFEVVPSTFAEDLDKKSFPHAWQYVSETSYRKAMDVHDILTKRGEKYDLIISADTIVVLNDQIVEKPESKEHAKQILRSLSGAPTHSVITSMTLLTCAKDQTPIAHRFYEETAVTFHNLSDEVIEHYVNTGLPLDKAGGYGIQDSHGGSLISGINGCYYNVVGLPIHRFCKELTKLVEEKHL